MLKKYNVELEGQIEFYEQYLKIVNPELNYEDIFRNNTDGILNGNILEFKLNITDLNACLFQTIKYLSAMRIKGEPIPANILLISLNTATIYLYHSKEYLNQIEKVYVGAASKNNAGFFAGDYISKLKYVEKEEDEFYLTQLLKENNYTKINIDENCIVSTIEYYEYKVLLELLGSKVRYIIPPTEKDDTFNMGLVRGADALSEEYINNPVIKQYIDNPDCTVILFENPPYAETTSAEHQKVKTSKNASFWKNSFVAKEMKKSIKGSALNDLGNAFIWSAFKYYLRQPTDSYIVYSPVKYWKAQHLINKNFIKGFAFNRKHFHTNIDACIMCTLWSNEDADLSHIKIDAFDIKNDILLVNEGKLSIDRIYSLYSQIYYDKRIFDDDVRQGVLIGLNGLEKFDGKIRNKPLYNKNVVGYLIANTSGFDNPDLNSGFLIGGRYDGNGFYVREDNYLEKLPMFCASRYITYNREWTERARIMKSADGADRFFADVKSGKLNQFLLKCLVFTCFEMQNHMRSFQGTDNRFYRNELCLDTTNGETLASRDLKNLKENAKEKELFDIWKTIFKWAQKTDNYNEKLTYGVYQIFAELNTFSQDEETGENKPDYPELNGALKTLKQKVKEYYNSEIVPVLFEYQFLK